MIKNLQRITQIFYKQILVSKFIIRQSPQLHSLFNVPVTYFSQEKTDLPPQSAQSKSEVNQQVQKQQKEKKKERVKPVINEKDLEWSFVKGSGPGGQCVNKTSNNAILIHKPTGIQVRSHASRELDKNKQYCLKQLSEKLDFLINGENSKKSQKENKKKKQDARRQRRSAEKYGNKNQEEKENEVEDETEDKP